jgi:xanthine dehydrogenase accessory factor
MMRDLLPKLLASVETKRGVALCRLVETRGSTPQKAGAAMLVFADGSQAGTLGGGCVEAEVKRRALTAIESKTMVVERFQLDDDYGWDDGLICGGRMQVLIDPMSGQSSRRYYTQLNEIHSAGEGATEVIVFDAAASGLDAPDCRLFNATNRLLAKCGEKSDSDQTPTAIVEALPALASRPSPSAASGIAILPTLPRCRLVIVGGGHVGQAVARLAAELDFLIWVVDDRTEYVTEERFPTAVHRIAGSIGQVLPNLEITSDTYCLIVTRGHNHDEEALYHLVDRGARYVGMIGSKRQIRLIFDGLLAVGISADALAKVHAPVGLDIGSQTVPEIAVSIAAELVAHRNQGGVGNWRNSSQ